MDKRKHFNVKEVNKIYLLLAIVFIMLGSFVQKLNIDLGIIVTEYFIILLPVLLYAKIKKIDLKSSLRLNKLKGSVVIKIFFLSMVLIPIIAFGNLLMMTILSYFGKAVTQETPTAQTLLGLFKYLFLIAFSAGLCEEVFFRGMILDAYENDTNKKFAVIVSAVLFGVFHFNLQNLIGPILLGLVFGYLVILTDSIWSGILAHMLNNGIAVIMSYVIQFVPVNAQSEVMPVDINEMTGQLVLALFSIGIFAFISFFIAKFILKSIKKEYIIFEENDRITLNKKEYLVVKKIDKGLILIDHSIDTKALSMHEIFDEMKLLSFEKIKKSNTKIDKKILTAEVYTLDNRYYYPIFITIGMYVFVMYFTWKSLGLVM